MSNAPRPFGKYLLFDEIATGGMARVYRAKLIGVGGFEKDLVVKQILPELARDPKFVEMFVAEARTAVSLAHGNIVPVFELGIEAGLYFISMEYVAGRTLEELTQAKVRFEPAEAACIVLEILDGLAYAHRRRPPLIHRDLSPNNVMVTYDGDVKILDFGVALRLGERSVRGERFGTHGYMSPEQLRDEPLDPRSDLFSVGVLLHEMLRGQRLFVRAGGEQTEQAVLGAPIDPPLAETGPGAREMNRIVARALERAAESRFDSAEAFATELRRWLHERGAAPAAAAIGQRIRDALGPPLFEEGADKFTPLALPAATVRLAKRAATAGGSKVLATNARFERILAQAQAPAEPFVGAPDRTPSSRRRSRLGHGALLLLAGAVAAAGLWALWAGGRAARRRARILVDSTPNGAIVECAGCPPGARTPVRIALLPTPVRIGIRRAGYRPAQQAIDPTPGATVTVHVYLEPLPGELEVQTEPAGARVRIDGVEAGVAPVVLRVLDRERPHVVEAALEGRVSARTVVDAAWRLRDDGTPHALVRLRLTEEPAAPPSPSTTAREPRGFLTLNVLPWGHVEIDGTAAPDAPLRDFPLRAGVHSITVRCPAIGRRRTVEVRLSAGEHARRVIDLTDGARP